MHNIIYKLYYSFLLYCPDYLQKRLLSLRTFLKKGNSIEI